MKRRTFVTGASTIATLGLAGCLGADRDVSKTDDEHVAELRAEISDRGVEFESVKLERDIVEVEHSYDEEPNDAVANVAMAFVERIADEWDVERLEGRLHDEGNTWGWHAEAEWAREYADGDIRPDEYGVMLSETLSRRSEAED